MKFAPGSLGQKLSSGSPVAPHYAVLEVHGILVEYLFISFINNRVDCLFKVRNKPLEGSAVAAIRHPEPPYPAAKLPLAPSAQRSPCALCSLGDLLHVICSTVSDERV